MANPNSEYIKDNSLQELFRDKDTGLPLSGGTVEFFRDKDHSVQKPVFKITGTAPNYSFVSQSNPIVLNSVGAVEDPIYYKPFDDDGAPDPYYIVVKNAQGVQQFTRENWPDIDESDTPLDSQGEVNYIPNGQFLDHNDLEATQDKQLGEIRQAITPVARGGFAFERPQTSTADDFVLFKRKASFQTNPEENPRYFINVKNEGQGANPGSTKDLTIKFEDVNKFASDTEEYTFKMFGQSNGGSFIVDLILIKDYGTNGSAPDSTTLTQFTVTAAGESHYFSFMFGDTAGKTIGPDDDDFVKLAIRFPTNQLFDGDFTDFVLVKGKIEDPQFPTTTDRQMLGESVGSGMPVPAYDGSDLYLPLTLSPEGVIFDKSKIGKMFPYTGLVDSDHPLPIGTLEANGQGFRTADKSSDGIPYSRLQDVYWEKTDKYPTYGAAPFFFLSSRGIPAVPATKAWFSTATPGSVTPPTDSGSSGFTFDNIHTGVAAGYYVTPFKSLSFEPAGAGIRVYVNERGPVTAASSATPAIVVEFYNKGKDINGTKTNEVFAITVVSIPPASSHWTFHSLNGGVAAPYYMWFKLDGAGTDPAVPGHTAIEVDILSTDTIEIVRDKIFQVLKGYQLTNFTGVASTSLNNTYFDIDSTTVQYRVWFNVGGTGVAPSPSGRELVEIKLENNTLTAAQVEDQVIEQMNFYTYAVPNMNGYFVRSVAYDSIVDDINGIRIGDTVVQPIGNKPGTVQMPLGIGSYAVVGPDGGVFGWDGTAAASEDPSKDSMWLRPWNKSFIHLINY
jgi:hypothetical protein